MRKTINCQIENYKELWVTDVVMNIYKAEYQRSGSWSGFPVSLPL